MKRLWYLGLLFLLLTGCSESMQSTSVESASTPIVSERATSSQSVPLSISSSQSILPSIRPSTTEVTVLEIPLPQEKSIQWSEAAVFGDWIALSGQALDSDSEGLYGAAAQFYLYRYSMTDSSASLLEFDTPIANGWTDGEADYWMAVNDWSIWRQPYGGEAMRIAEGEKRGMGAPYLSLSGDTLIWEEYKETQTEEPYLELYSLETAERKTIPLKGRIASADISNGVITTACERDGAAIITVYDLSAEKCAGVSVSVMPNPSESPIPSAAYRDGSVLLKRKNGGLILQEPSGFTFTIADSGVKSFAFWENQVLFTTNDALFLYDMESVQLQEVYTLQEGEHFLGRVCFRGEIPGVVLEKYEGKEQQIFWLEITG